jgi:hypothetical protein
MLLLDSPYPATGSVVVVNQTSQLVDATLRPVPLSEVYGAPLATCCLKFGMRSSVAWDVSGGASAS